MLEYSSAPSPVRGGAQPGEPRTRTLRRGTMTIRGQPAAFAANDKGDESYPGVVTAPWTKAT